MVFKRLFEISRISNFTNEELMNYESDMKRFSDHANALAYAEEKGETSGVKKGILQTAKNMLKEGLNPTLVARITKLPRKEILALKRA
jgi:predicted transposase/invertase (TIGR01784 family)